MVKLMKYKEQLIAVMVFTIIVCCTVGFVSIHTQSQSVSLGRRVLYLMYSYDDLEEDIPRRYDILRTLVSEDDWKFINIDTTFRPINAYYKLKGDPTKVNIVYEEDGLLVYRLINEHVSKNSLWVMEYDIDHGRLCNIREYSVPYYQDGGGGGFFD